LAYARHLDPSTVLSPNGMVKLTDRSIIASFISVFVLFQMGALTTLTGAMAYRGMSSWVTEHRVGIIAAFIIQCFCSWPLYPPLVYLVMVNVFDIWIDL
jgi:hypothetical protein